MPHMRRDFRFLFFKGSVCRESEIFALAPLDSADRSMMSDLA